jgi:hypothetical protein
VSRKEEAGRKPGGDESGQDAVVVGGLSEGIGGSPARAPTAGASASAVLSCPRVAAKEARFERERRER